MARPKSPIKDVSLPTSHWAKYALEDIREALDADRYDVARHHISDAIAAIIARDEQGEDYDNSTDVAGSSNSRYPL